MEPRVSVSQITTVRSSFADDVRLYAAAGLDGIGVWELKLGEGGDAEALELFEASGLESAAAVPAIPSILPLPLLGGPEDPAERVEAFCASLERLAPFRPSGIVCLTGTGEGREPDEARAHRRRRPAHDRARGRAARPADRRSSRTSATAASCGRSPPRSRRRSS